MTLTSRTGAAPLAFLLGGIALVVVIFAIAVLGNQASASAELGSKLSEANQRLVAAGLPADETLPKVKGAAINLQKTKEHAFCGASFRLPASLKNKNLDDSQTEFASRDDLFGQSIVPASQVLIKLKCNQQFAQLNTIEELATRAPYMTKHSLRLVSGRYQALIITNEYKGTRWKQIYIGGPQGPYTSFVVNADTKQADQIIDLILSSMSIKDEAK